MTRPLISPATRRRWSRTRRSRIVAASAAAISVVGGTAALAVTAHLDRRVGDHGPGNHGHHELDLRRPGRGGIDLDHGHHVPLGVRRPGDHQHHHLLHLSFIFCLFLRLLDPRELTMSTQSTTPTITPVVTEEHFPIMGSAGHLVVVGGPAGLARSGVEQLDELESRWSRFRATSEITRLNEADGAPCLVSGPTRLLIEAMLSAWELTGGRFDPTVGHALQRLGYDHSWPLLSPPIRLPRPERSVGCAEVRLDLDQGLVQLPRHVTLDPGGLGKGLAADVVATALMAAGADGVLVNVGGDLRVIGTAPEGDDWLIAVEHPDHPEDPRHHLTHLAITGGGVATSTAARRHWSTRDGTPVHHLIDPTTSLPAVTTRRQVTVVAGCAWWAEALAKVAFLDGTLPDVQAGALIVERDGATSSIGHLDRFAHLEGSAA